MIYFVEKDFDGNIIKVEIARRVQKNFDSRGGRGGGRGGGGRGMDIHVNTNIFFAVS